MRTNVQRLPFENGGQDNDQRQNPNPDHNAAPNHPFFANVLFIVHLCFPGAFAAFAIFESRTPLFIIMRWLTIPCLSTTFARATTSPTSSPRPAIPKRFIVFVGTSWVLLPMVASTLILLSTLFIKRALARGSVGFPARSTRVDSVLTVPFGTVCRFST